MLVIPCLMLLGLGASTGPGEAHPGRTDAEGCHTCRTNCSRYGLSTGQYHCHGGTPAPLAAPPPRAASPRTTPPRQKIELFGGGRSEPWQRPEDPNLIRLGLEADADLSGGAGLTAVRVLAVVDGDTFVARHLGRLYLLRIHGLDAPELEQPFGSSARAVLRERLGGRTVWVREVGADGCTIGVDVAGPGGGGDLGAELVAEGIAWCSPSAPAPCGRLEAAARRREVGLWSGSRPEPPWDFVERRMGSTRQ